MLVEICALGLYIQLINDIGERDTESEWTVHYLNFNWPVTDCDSYIKQWIFFQLLCVQHFSYWCVS